MDIIEELLYDLQQKASVAADAPTPLRVVIDAPVAAALVEHIRSLTARMSYIERNFVGATFDYDGEGMTAMVVRISDRVSVSRDAAAVLDAAIAQAAVPEECPHTIVFDDTDREPLIFAGSGAREAALKTWAQISNSWNAHLFVRIGSNSRDDSLPSAMLAAAPAAPVAQEPATWPAAAHNLVRDWQTGMASSNEVCIALASALCGTPPAAEPADTVKVPREVLRVLTDTAISEWHDPGENESSQDRNECLCCGVEDGHNTDCAVAIALRLLAGGAHGKA